MRQFFFVRRQGSFSAVIANEQKTSSADSFSAAIIEKCNEMPNIQLSRLTLCCSECLSLRPGFEHVRSEVTFGQTSAELHAHESTRRIA